MRRPYRPRTLGGPKPPPLNEIERGTNAYSTRAASTFKGIAQAEVTADEWRLLEELPPEIRQVLRDEPIAMPSVKITHAGWQDRKSFMSVAEFVRLLKEAIKADARKITTQTYGPTHPNAELPPLGPITKT